MLLPGCETDVEQISKVSTSITHIRNIVGTIDAGDRQSTSCSEWAGSNLQSAAHQPRQGVVGANLGRSSFLG